MTEALPQNSHPLNQRCKNLLKRAGEIPDPTQMHFLHLLRWAVESGEISETKLAPIPFKTVIEEMEARPPESLMQWMTVDAEGNPLEIETQIAKLNPTETAAYLMEEASAKLRVLMD